MSFFRVGLTGGMGAGKSTVARKFQELGALIIDSDALAREVLAKSGAAYSATVATFGQEILKPDGEIDRERLAEVVFADPTKRALLEALVHPEIAKRRDEILAHCRPEDLVIEDVPLLVEKGLAELYQAVIVVTAPTETRIARLVDQRGLTEQQVRARIGSQATDDQRMAVADFVVDNSGDIDSSDAQIREIWQRLQQLARQ